MRSLRCILIMACFAAIAPAVLAADKTTAVWSDGHASALSDEELVRYALASPGPGYPQEAQRTKAAGSGLYELRLDKAGVPKSVVIVKSSGSVVLDNAATTTFRKWRFKPGIFTSVRVPVAWSANPVRN
jgi:TonB family protein